MGFARVEVQKLQAAQAELFRKMTYATDLAKHKVKEYWEGAKAICPPGRALNTFKGDCEEFAMLAVQKARAMGLDARLVVCLTETKEGHCIAEISSKDGEEAYFMDNRKRSIATKQDLPGYTFFSVSPWNPVAGDTRKWFRVK